VRTFFGQKGEMRFFRCRHWHFGAKNFGFFEIYGVSARTREKRDLSQYRHFTDKEEGQFFVFYERPLTVIDTYRNVLRQIY